MASLRSAYVPAIHAFIRQSKNVDARDKPGHDDVITIELEKVTAQPPRRISSVSEDDTDGTCSPSEAREMATRVLLKTLSMPGAPCAFKWLRSSSDQHAVVALGIVGDLAG